jgi:hypothetical protein
MLAQGGCMIDIGENWVKQTARNRADILTAGGVASLTVPVHGGSNGGGIDCSGVNDAGAATAKIRTKDIRIDNSKRWQHIHRVSIASAYRGSPFFDHYEERFAPIFARRFDFLVDLNLEVLDILTSILGLDRPGISENYIVPAQGDIDLRGKKALRRSNITQSPEPQEYIQVFHDRMPFEPGLSVIDLVFCEGPAAREFLV